MEPLTGTCSQWESNHPVLIFVILYFTLISHTCFPARVGYTFFFPFYLFIFGCTKRIVGSQFPDQALTLDHGSESLES